MERLSEPLELSFDMEAMITDDGFLGLFGIEGKPLNPDFLFNIAFEAGTALIWISTEVVPNYRYTLQIKDTGVLDLSTGNPAYLFSGKQRCVPFDMRKEEVREKSSCLVIDQGIVKKASERGWLEIILTIHKSAVASEEFGKSC